MGGGGSGGGGQSTVSQTAIPDWQQGMVQSNENLATSLASQPYPTYNAQLIAGFSPQQQQGMQMAGQASTAQQPDLASAEQMTQGAPGMAAPYQQAAGNMASNSASPWNAQTAQQYMSPYAMAAMQPQIQALQLQQAQNANQINGQATRAGAFGDAQYGNEQALNNFYAGQNMNNLVSQGMNTAYNTGLGAFQTGQQQQLGAANTLNNVGTGMANTNLASANQMGNLGQAQQSTGIAGANAMFNAGTQQQQLQQQQLTEAYQNFMNQANWPYQGLNMRIASTANSPYQVPTANLAPSSASAANLGAFASAAGGLGNLLSGSGGSGAGSVYGGTPSDRRLKKNIKKVGELENGIPFHIFNYVWELDSDRPWLGVMADEVLEKIPNAVRQDEHGYMMVNYSMVH